MGGCEIDGRPKSKSPPQTRERKDDDQRSGSSCLSGGRFIGGKTVGRREVTWINDPARKKNPRSKRRDGVKITKKHVELRTRIRIRK